MGRQGTGRRWTSQLRIVAVVAACAWFASGCLWMNRVNVTQAGGQTADAAVLDMSADGRYVLFASAGFPGSWGNGFYQVFRRDNATGAVALVSATPSGVQGNGHASVSIGALSADGRYALFSSAASDLVPSDQNGVWDVFVRDLVAGTTTLASVPRYGGQGFEASYGWDISDDGRYVLFESDAGNFVPGDTNGETDVFRRDLTTGEVLRVSIHSSGAQLAGYSSAATFDPTSPDRILFTTPAPYAASFPLGTLDDLEGDNDLIRATVSAGTVSTSCRTCFLEGDVQGRAHFLGPTGVVFATTAQIPGSGDADALVDVYHLTVAYPTVPAELIAVGEYGTPLDGSNYAPSVSSDGRYVTFTSDATNLAPDTNGVDDVFVHDRLDPPGGVPPTRRVSVSETGAEGASNAPSWGGIISGNGEFVAFNSTATNFVGTGQVPKTTPGQDVFVRLAQPGPAVAFPSTASPYDVPPGGSLPITVIGQFFRPNTALSADHAGITFSNVVVVNDQLISATMSVGANVPPGDYSLNVSDVRASWDLKTIALTQATSAIAVGDRVGLVQSNEPYWPSLEVGFGQGNYEDFQAAAGAPVHSDPRLLNSVTLPDAPLASHACLVLPANTVPFDASELAALQAYVQGGGTLFAVGEQPAFADIDTTMNALSTALGAHLSIVPGSGPHDPGGATFKSTTNIEPVSPFTDGVASLGYASAGELSVGAPGQVLVRTTLGVPILAVEQIGAGQLVMASDSNLLSDYNDGAYTTHDNGTLVDNLCRYG